MGYNAYVIKPEHRFVPESTYDQDNMDEICQRIASGESLRSACKAVYGADRAAGMSGTIVYWVNKDKNGCAAQYAQARQLQAEFMADELTSIADEGTNDYMERLTASGELQRVYDKEHIARSRLRIDTRKWIMSKVLPKKYGEKLEVTGAGGGPVRTESITALVAITDPIEAAKAYRKIMNGEGDTGALGSQEPGLHSSVPKAIGDAGADQDEC